MNARLDRIEAILESTAVQQAANTATLDRVSEQQVRNADDIETLLGAVSTNEVACRELRAAGAASDVRIDRLVEKIDESNQRFDIQRAEAVADRHETARLFNDTVAQIEVDRAEYREKFDQAIAQINTAIEQAKADREESRRRFDAQQENIQRLLVELLNTNRDATKLRDRVDNLEQAS